MKKLSVLFGAVLLASTAFAAVAQAGDELTVVSWGGAYSESQRKAYYEPYMAAGNKITEAEYNRLRLRVANRVKNPAAIVLAVPATVPNPPANSQSSPVPGPFPPGYFDDPPTSPPTNSPPPGAPGGTSPSA